MKIEIDGKRIEIDSASLVELVLSCLPGWLAGAEPATGQQQLLKSGIKALLPIMLTMFRSEFERDGIPVPDLRVQEAKKNAILYIMRHILSHGLAKVDEQPFTAITREGQYGEILIMGFVPSAAVVDATVAIATADDGNLDTAT